MSIYVLVRKISGDTCIIAYRADKEFITNLCQRLDRLAETVIDKFNNRTGFFKDENARLFIEEIDVIRKVDPTWYIGCGTYSVEEVPLVVKDKDWYVTYPTEK